ncbi:hypothetical protein [Vibrio alginolyticus]|uniref:hypothetical protein n=1 Tax=Vibrio alginolyticus TaxID=663 RepID=UPI0010BD8946|nr:hypothetical protein [Vibrio alginolyticus]TKF03663.1 hypothetical protein FCV48_24835 [Vibrio alginolyticus]
MDRIEFFNVIAAEIFHRSLETFPVPTEVNYDQIGQISLGYFPEPSTEELFDVIVDAPNSAQHALLWLEREGFISISQKGFDSCFIVMTLKGLNAVNSVPKNIEQREPFIVALKKGV